MHYNTTLCYDRIHSFYPLLLELTIRKREKSLGAFNCTVAATEASKIKRKQTSKQCR